MVECYPSPLGNGFTDANGVHHLPQLYKNSITSKPCSQCNGKGSPYKDVFTDIPCKKCQGSGIDI